jgi:hypothetical protein
MLHPRSALSLTCGTLLDAGCCTAAEPPARQSCGRCWGPCGPAALFLGATALGTACDATGCCTAALVVAAAFLCEGHT